MISGVFGLLALLLAFAFSLAIGRHEERRELVIAEANAIGTLSSRLSLLPGDVRAPLARDLREYARHRLLWGRAGEEVRLAAAAAHAARAGLAFERQLFGYLASAPFDTRTALLVQATNAVNDVAAERHAARMARLPGAVIALLAAYCLIGATVLGLAIGDSARGHRIETAAFFAILALAFVTVLDLDRPRGGLITVPQDELELTVASLKS